MCCAFWNLCMYSFYPLLYLLCVYCLSNRRKVKAPLADVSCKVARSETDMTL